MKEQVRNVFSQITMPETTEWKIQGAMTKHRQKPALRKTIGRIVASAAAMIVLIFAISPTAQAAVKDWVVKYFFPGSDITIYEKVDESGNTVGIAVVDTEAPGFARIVNGRLFFLGNGEKIDITDVIAEDAPFFYEYVDDYGLTHMMAVGFSGSIDNFGIYEFIRNMETGDWVTGTGRNFLSSETENRYPWVDSVWDHWNVPWPMPE